MLGSRVIFTKSVIIVRLSGHNGNPARLCVSRIMSVLLTVAYLLSVILHGLVDVDVVNRYGSSSAIVLMDGKDSQSPEWGLVADHHCHCCFSVSVPAPAQQAELALDLKIAELPKSAAPLYGNVSGLDPPPPKSLT